MMIKGKNRVIIIGGGLSGSEASLWLTRAGIKVTLFDMKPQKFTPAHKSPKFAELVCSNSFRSQELSSAIGLLKEELRILSSPLITTGYSYRVPAGKALAVDREKFSHHVTQLLKENPFIDIEVKEITSLEEYNNEIVIVATGPLTTDALSLELQRIGVSKNLYYYDAIAPIVDADSIDWSKVFIADRYNEGGEGSYVNCPLTEEEYFKFVEALKEAPKVNFKEFEKLEEVYFEGCLPIEVMIERGKLTLAYGPMKPVGLKDPRTGKMPFAVVQLRPEDKEATAYNMVGFQTKLTYQAQKEVFRMIPGLEHAEFLRYGSVHRNTFLNSPEVLQDDMSLKSKPNIFIAGQLTGVEGYVESIASGFLTSLFVISRLKGVTILPPPPFTALGGLYYHLRHKRDNFQPSNITWALIKSPLHFKRKGEDKKNFRKLISQYSLNLIKEWWEKVKTTLEINC